MSSGKFVSFDALLDKVVSSEHLSGLSDDARVAFVKSLDELGRVYFIHCIGCTYFRDGHCGHPNHEVSPPVYPMDGCTKGVPKGYTELS